MTPSASSEGFGVALRFVYARFARAHCCARCKFVCEHLQGVSVATVVDRRGRWV